MPTRQDIGEMLDRDRQEGGAHYRKYAIQPVEYTVKNGLSFLAGNVIKYVTRYKDKNGAEDIRKAIHYLNLILEFEYPAPTGGQRPEQFAVAPAPAPEAVHVNPIEQTLHELRTANQDPKRGGPMRENRHGGPELILKLDSTDPDTVGETR